MPAELQAVRAMTGARRASGEMVGAFAKGGGRHSHFTPENGAEITAVTEAAAIRDCLNRKIGLEQKISGQGEALAHEITLGREAHVAFEQADETTDAHRGEPGHRFARPGQRHVARDLRDDALHPCVGGRGSPFRGLKTSQHGADERNAEKRLGHRDPRIERKTADEFGGQCPCECVGGDFDHAAGEAPAGSIESEVNEKMALYRALEPDSERRLRRDEDEAITVEVDPF